MTDRDEIVDHCGGCNKPLTESQIAFRYLDNDPVMCAACAPTEAEQEAGRIECKETRPDGCIDEHCGSHPICWPKAIHFPGKE